MKQYYLLMPDANRADLEAVDDYEMGDFDLTRFWEGIPYLGDIPKEVKIDLDTGKPCDLLGNPMSWLIVSHRLQRVIEKLSGDSVQFIPLIVWKAKKPVDRYVLANPLKVVDAINSKKKKDVNIQRMSLSLSRIPEDSHIFRLRHQENTIVISKELFELLYGKGYEGLAARPVIAQ